MFSFVMKSDEVKISFDYNFWSTLCIKGVSNLNDVLGDPCVVYVKEDYDFVDILADFYPRIFVRPAFFVYDNSLCSAVFFKKLVNKSLDLDDYFLDCSFEEFKTDFNSVLVIFDKKYYNKVPKFQKIKDFSRAALLDSDQNNYLDHQFYVLSVFDKTFENLDKFGFNIVGFRDNFENFIKFQKLSVFSNFSNLKSFDGVKYAKIEDVLEIKKNNIVLYNSDHSKFNL